jgi:hypothetical protein
MPIRFPQTPTTYRLRESLIESARPAAFGGKATYADAFGNGGSAAEADKIAEAVV